MVVCEIFHFCHPERSEGSDKDKRYFTLPADRQAGSV